MDSIWNLAKRSKAGKDVGGRAEKIRQAVDGEPEKAKDKDAVKKAEGGSVQPQGKALEDFRRQRDEQRRKKAEDKAPTTKTEMGKVFKKGGMVGSASKRADGCAVRGKTKGRMV
jgi:hypothetical protein